MLTANDLLAFCNPERRGFYLSDLSVPWSAGDFSYASNGHILLRVPRLAEIPENSRAPKVDRLFPDTPASEWWPIPAENDDLAEWEEESVRIGPAVFGSAPLRLLWSLPNCEIGPTGQYSPAWIRFDGGDGILMPRTR